MMASPNAAVVEYALMKDFNPKRAIGNRPPELITKVVIPLNDKESITVRRTSADRRKTAARGAGRSRAPASRS